MKKYELTDETIEFYGRTLHRIRACRDFVTIAGKQVKVGDLGGFVETEENLSHDGMCCVPSQQKWTQKSFKKRNESQYFVNLRNPTAFIPRFA